MRPTTAVLLYISPFIVLYEAFRKSAFRGRRKTNYYFLKALNISISSILALEQLFVGIRIHKASSEPYDMDL